ncbi:unnamed protein product [Clonostachys rosea]|uniref:C2H2-type domain-containing protein n=1 Tax=Bionectria ochroleuca TaxID=29856 RepID=A0ABY6UZL1_BIOOC|nr:unnamed protein product [Clonostachys rosea]
MSTAMIVDDANEFGSTSLPSGCGHALGSLGLLATWSTPVNVSSKEEDAMQDAVASHSSPSTCMASAAGSYGGVDLNLSFPGQSSVIRVPSIRRLEADLKPPTTQASFKFCSPQTNRPNLVVTAGYQVVSNDGASFSTSSGSLKRHTQKEGVQANHGGDGGGQREEWRGHGGGEGPSQPFQTGLGEASEGWACPFYKFDPVRHWRCYRKYNLKRLADVKSHIMRVHLMSEPYCPNCFQEFNNTQEWHQHCSLPVLACTQVQGPEPLFREDFDALGDMLATAQGLSEADRWYLMFDHIFPNAGWHRPVSPFVSLSFDEPLGIMRAHASRQEQLYQSIISVLEHHQIPLERISGLDALQADLMNAVLPTSAAAMAATPPYQRAVHPSRLGA